MKIPLGQKAFFVRLCSGDGSCSGGYIDPWGVKGAPNKKDSPQLLSGSRLGACAQRSVGYNSTCICIRIPRRSCSAIMCSLKLNGTSTPPATDVGLRTVATCQIPLPWRKPISISSTVDTAR
jgi:hypothetical protein